MFKAAASDEPVIKLNESFRGGRHVIVNDDATASKTL
ncbi:hypothetical protein ACMYR2_1340 [Nitrobacter sp. TKz-YC01]